MRLKRYLAGFPARRAYCVIHLTVSAPGAGLAFLGIAASLAALRFVGESFFSEKFLLASSEGEFFTAIAADQSLVFVHIIPR